MANSELPIEAVGSETAEKESEQMEKGLKEELERLANKGIISHYTTIQSFQLGFPLKRPANTLVNRVDNLIKTFEELGIEEVRDMFYDKATEFFGTDNVSRWTAELDTLAGKDPEFKDDDARGCKNALAKEAFLAIVYYAGYVMARAEVVNGKLPALEGKLDGKYLRRTIEL